MCVQCTADGNGETRIDFLLYHDLDKVEIGNAKDFIDRVRRLGEAERLTPRKLGFGR